MPDKTSEEQEKRKSQGHRKHIRRLKQAARKAGLPYYEPREHIVRDNKEPA